MPYKNEDFQDFFQKAGSDYPLRTDNSDWDNVASRLDAAANEPKAPNSRFLKYTFIFLLLLSGSIIFYKFQFYTDKIVLQEQSTKQHRDSEAIRKSAEHTVNEGLAPVDIKTDFSLKDFNSYTNQSKLQVSANWSEIEAVAMGHLKTVSAIKKDINAIVPLKLNEAGISSLEHTNHVDQTTNIISENKNPGSINKLTTLSSAINPDNIKSTKQLVKFRHLPSKFYGTFYASPVFSTVKFQKIDKPGYKLGVALGYSINKRFDVEIGLQREHINFYSDGKYFERTALPIKSDDAVLSNVDGDSKITSIPVTLKYNFASKGNSHFYMAAGINVLQITHAEVYDYIVSKNGRERDRSKRYSSVSDPKYFTGIIASAGYEAKVCNWFSLKAEPYYQMPIQNFGIGKLPVTSFGINIGIVKRLN
ncbi:MAG TPA: hypothetical protein VFW07_02170 [Parafilimonas sp.]|nr:hypothetical protein [Parafilimonas sp.]